MTSLLGVLFGRAFTEISNQAFGTGFDTYGPIVTVFALLAILIGWIVLSRGPVTISKLNRFVAPGLIVVVGFMMVMLMSQNSWADLLAAPPVAPFEDEQLNFMMAVEFNLGAGLSWWPVVGTLARLTRGPRAAVWLRGAGCSSAPCWRRSSAWPQASCSATPTRPCGWCRWADRSSAY